MGFFDFLSKAPLVSGFFEKPIIPVLRFSGILSDSERRGALSYERYRKAIHKSFELPNLKCVVLTINCPGGSPAQSEMISNLIRERAKEKDIPVYAFIEDLAASGGYWLACSADRIFATRTSLTGSIGVISAGFGLDEFINKHGIKRRLYTQGKEKSLLDPFLPEKQSDVKRIGQIQKEIHQDFIQWVKNRRSDALSAEDKDIFEGQIWTSAKAKDLGIIDDIGSCDMVLKEKFGDDHIRVDIPVEKKLFALPFARTQSKTDFGPVATEIIEILEEKSLWARYGF